MTVKELLKGIADTDILSPVAGVTSDSRQVERGYVFVCIKGNNFDGHNAANEVLSKGAAAVITERKLGLEREITVSDSRRAYPEILSAFYGRPTKRLRLAAVTGTNGKTTTVNLCAQIAKALGVKTGVIGTLGVDTGERFYITHSDTPTTPEPKKLYEYFKKMADCGTKMCFAEASSQALAQHRFAAEKFEAAAFTNLTQDHLDYHKTMENYYLAKRGLFDMCENAVINIDDEYGRRTAEYCGKNNIPCFTTSVLSEADFYTEYVNQNAHGTDFMLTDKAAKKSYPVSFPMTGLYNVSNAVQAAVLCARLGFDLGDCLSALEKSSGVRGRLETIYKGKFTVIRDYAHTADGLDKALSTLRPVIKGRLICLFGAAGERDAGKRPDMGAAASRYADYLVITSDNPRFEDMQSIIDDVKRGVPEGTPFSEFTDRRRAIEFALSMLKEGDLLALCGKGHEDYQVIGDEYIHFDEKEIVKGLLKV